MCVSLLSRVTSQNTVHTGDRYTLVLNPVPYIKLNSETHQWKNLENLGVFLARVNQSNLHKWHRCSLIVNMFQVQYKILHQDTQHWGNKERTPWRWCCPARGPSLTPTNNTSIIIAVQTRKKSKAQAALCTKPSPPFHY